MRGNDKVYSIINWLILLLLCIILVVLYTSTIIKPYVIILNILIILLALAKIYISFKINHRMKKIIEQIDRVASGNLNTRILVKEGGLIGELAYSFNKVLEKLQKTKEKEIITQESRRKLMSNMSHDIRTPLTSIIGYIDALKDGVAVDEQERLEYLQIISTKSKNLKSLIDEIFHMAKLDSGDITMDFKIHDIAEIMRECIIGFLPEINKKEIKLVADISEDKELIYCDELSISRVLNNILENAIQYGGGEKVLGVELISLESKYQINIWDRGPGIEQEHIPFIFERLYIKDKARKKPLGSSGLGLAITKKLLEKHGGKIWVESKPYEKTVFSLTIPKL